MTSQILMTSLGSVRESIQVKLQRWRPIVTRQKLIKSSAAGLSWIITLLTQRKRIATQLNLKSLKRIKVTRFRTTSVTRFHRKSFAKLALQTNRLNWKDVHKLTPPKPPNHISVTRLAKQNQALCLNSKLWSFPKLSMRWRLEMR